MSQNLAVQTALKAGVGAVYLNVDGAGNLLTSSGTSNGGTAVFSASGNVANAAAVATLPAVAGVTNYLSGLTITGAGATAASVVSATVTGLKGGTATYTVTVPAGVTTAVAPLNLVFYPALPASAANTAIVVTLPALGAGNTNASVTAWGFNK